MVFELRRAGATPGKRTMGLKVVMDNGLPVTPAASITRNLLRVADFLPLAFAAAAVSMLTRADGKRLGDIAAATLVVHQPRPAPKATLDMVTPIAPAAAALAARPGGGDRAGGARAHAHARTARRAGGAGGLGAGRAREPQDLVTRRVLGVAQWLLGRRQ